MSNIDIMAVKATKPQSWTQLRDGKLVSFWVPMMLVPGYRDPIAIAKGGKMLECDTYQEASDLATELVAQLQAEAQEAQP